MDFEEDTIPPDDDLESAGIAIPTIQVDISEEQIEELSVDWSTLIVMTIYMV